MHMNIWDQDTCFFTFVSFEGTFFEQEWQIYIHLFFHWYKT